MDLLTSDGWLPSYRYVPIASPDGVSNFALSISAVLMQIKLAISNLDPKPARLAHNWNMSVSSSRFSTVAD
jgi:ubiquitin-conjugating enzyme E2 Q